MRLSRIKLSGFKSFVDPAVLQLPGNLVGIVGPNGCGKSNVIDAVRWVMGESSARSLRGETMTDVIFNGAASRKPVGQASIELVFDNSQGRLGGPWASYAEIAVRRLVGRDGQSSYFLNGSRCRRRDIADLFLGTGLGPRSYAIIEQGMISRVIEARPEDLRLFLEEAAGISRYKDRRRETETRIRHTRDNLERLNDVREELGRQLQHLQRQARAAEQYRNYRAEERRLRAELLALRWRTLRVDLDAQIRQLREQETALEAWITAQRHLDTRLEAERLARTAASDACGDAQARCYQAGAEISRLEQYLSHQRELRRRHADDARQTAAELARIEVQREQDLAQREQLRAELAAAGPEQVRVQAAEVEAAAALATAEVLLREDQAAWEDCGRRCSDAQRQAEVERTRIEHLERQLLQGARRRERLELEQAQLAQGDEELELEERREAEEQAAIVLADHQARLLEVESELAATRAAQQQGAAALQELRTRVQTGRGRLEALRTLQEAALGRQADVAGAWLRTQGLDAAPRLAEHLTVEPGWERAVEAALSGWLDAVCVPELKGPAGAIAELHAGRLGLFAPPESTAASTEDGTLAERVTAPWSLASLLAGIDTAATLEEALARRASLAAGERLVTPEGVLCTRDAVRLVRDTESGVLAREREIHEREAALAADEVALARRGVEMEALSAQLHSLEQARREAQQQVNQGHRDHAQAQGRLQAAQSRAETACTRRAALAEECAELDEQNASDQEQLQQVRLRLEEVLLELESGRNEQVALGSAREQRQQQLRQCRAVADTARQAVARGQAALEALRLQWTATDAALERLDAQQRQLRERQQRLDTEPGTVSDDILVNAEADLGEWLETRLAAERALQEARQDLASRDASLQALEQERSRSEREIDAQRQRIEAQRLALGEARVREQHLCEQLQALDTTPEALVPTLPAVAEEGTWLVRLEQLERRIQRLGPINLAAIEEFAQLSERKQYLDAQDADLLEALATLENAMRKMDRETRARFRETFEQVNAGLQELFPRLFGGGQAHLELTQEDMLEAGVTIMAKPPGKRIGSITLLSGGEKALTAVALVFAIFQLNPAPFCLLDEVDAPLDEANVGRFGALVRDMSTRVQFIFITHNKATMEIAQHLIGVTMQEPGVSRLVAVDVDAAAQLAGVG